MDDREKTPLPFAPNLVTHDNRVPWSPSSRIVQVRTLSQRLETGDYVLAGHPRAGCVERKAHLSEIHNNLFDERRHRLFTAELSRLRSTFSHPLLLIEGSPSRPLPVKPGLPPSDLILDALMSLLARYNVPVLFVDGSTVDARRNIARIVARHLIHAAHSSESAPCPRCSVSGSTSTTTP